MFLGIVHFITATRFLMPDIIRGYVGPLESELQGAAIRGCSYLVKQCINYGVDTNATEFLPASPETPTIFPEMNGWGDVSPFSAIHIASIMGQIDVVNILIKEGADLNIVSPPYNFTALHSVMAILCELEGSETVSNEEDDGYVKIILPEHELGPSQIYLNLARLLIKSGADTMARDIYDKSPGHYALKAKLHDILELMLPKWG